MAASSISRPNSVDLEGSFKLSLSPGDISNTGLGSGSALLPGDDVALEWARDVDLLFSVSGSMARPRGKGCVGDGPFAI
jgi:hypothetical protein